MNNTENIYALSSKYTPWHLILQATFGIVISIVGVLANSLTIITLLGSPQLRNAASYFIVSLSAADLIFSGIGLPILSASYLGSMWVADTTWCTLTPLLVYGNFGVSLNSIVFITVNRYIKIIHYRQYESIYQPRNIALMILYCWIFSYLIQMPTLFGVWGKFSYDVNTRTCNIVPDLSGRTSKQALLIMGFVLPCIVIVVCYTRILYVVYMSEGRLLEHAANFHVEKRRKQMELRKTRMVLMIFITQVACFLPIAIIKNTDKQMNYPGLHVIAQILINLSACVNPLIYVVMNRLYRQSYIKMLQRARRVICARCSSTSHVRENIQLSTIGVRKREEDCSRCTSELSGNSGN